MPCSRCGTQTNNDSKVATIARPELGPNGGFEQAMMIMRCSHLGRATVRCAMSRRIGMERASSIVGIAPFTSVLDGLGRAALVAFSASTALLDVLALLCGGE